MGLFYQILNNKTMKIYLVILFTLICITAKSQSNYLFPNKYPGVIYEEKEILFKDSVKVDNDSIIINRGNSANIKPSPYINIDLYPNPFTSEFVINFSQPNTYIIRFYDLKGTCFKEVKVVNVNTVTLGGDLSSGYYMIKISEGSNDYFFKINKQ